MPRSQRTNFTVRCVQRWSAWRSSGTARPALRAVSCSFFSRFSRRRFSASLTIPCSRSSRSSCSTIRLCARHRNSPCMHLAVAEVAHAFFSSPPEEVCLLAHTMAVPTSTHPVHAQQPRSIATSESPSKRSVFLHSLRPIPPSICPVADHIRTHHRGLSTCFTPRRTPLSSAISSPAHPTQCNAAGFPPGAVLRLTDELDR